MNYHIDDFDFSDENVIPEADGWDFAEPAPEAVINEDPTVEDRGLLTKTADYMLDPLDKPDSVAYDTGKESYKSTAEVNKQANETATEAPEMEGRNAVYEAFSGQNFSVAQINSFMDYHLAQGKKKNEVLGMLKDIEATPRDIQIASASNRSSRELSSEEAIDTHIVEPLKRGAMRGRLATYDLATDLNAALGAPEEETIARRDKSDNMKGIMQGSRADLAKDTGFVSPLEMLPEVATLAISGGGAIAIGVKEATAEFLISKSDGFSNGQSLARALTLGMITGGATRMLEGPALSKRGLTAETENLLEYADIKKGTDEYKDLTNQALQVDPNDQARIIAEQLGAKDLGFKSKALQGADDQTRHMYANTMADRTKEVAQATGLDDFPAIKEATQAQYDTMREVAKNVSTGDYYNVGDIATTLKVNKNAFINTPAEARIEKLVAKIEDMPSMALDDIIDIRQSVNYEIGRTTDKNAKYMLGQINKDLTQYLKHSELPPSVFEMVESSTKSYHRMKSQEELVGYMEKAQVTLNKNSKYGEITVTDWSKLEEIIKKDGLPKIMQDEVALMKQMSSKYSDTEVGLIKSTRPAGEAENVGAIIAESPEGFARTGLTQRAIEGINRWLNPMEKGKKIRIQNSIRNSMAKGKTYSEFAENMIKDKNTPLKIRQVLQTYIDDHDDLLAITGPASKAESKALHKKAQKMKVGVDGAENSAIAANTKYENVVAYGKRLDKALEQALEEGNDGAIASLQNAIAKNELAMEAALKKKDVAHRGYTIRRDDYEAFASKNKQWLKDSDDFGQGLKSADMPARSFKSVPANKEFPTLETEVPRDTPVVAPDAPVRPKGSTDTSGSFTGGGINKADDFETTTAMPVKKPTVYTKEDGSVNINRPYYDYKTKTEMDATSQIKDTQGRGRDTAEVVGFPTHGGDSRLASDTILDTEATKSAMYTDDSAMRVLGVHSDILEKQFGKPYVDLAKTIIKDNPEMAISVSKGNSIRTNTGLAGGVSDSPQGTVNLPRGAEGTAEGASTFLHEVVHQATVQRYNEDRVFREAMDNLFKYAKKESGSGGYGNGGLYWEANPKEMMAEAFSNPKAQAELMAMPTPSWFRDKYPKLTDTVKNAWDAFVFLVTGASTSKIPTDNVMTAMGDLLASQVNKAPSGQGADDLIKSAMNVDPFVSGGIKQVDEVSSFTKSLETNGIVSVDSDVEDLLEAASIPVKDRKGKMERLTRRSQHNPNVDVPRAIIETSLTMAQAKRLKAGKGTPEDIAELKEDLAAYRIEYGGASQDTPVEDILKGKM